MRRWPVVLVLALGCAARGPRPATPHSTPPTGAASGARAPAARIAIDVTRAIGDFDPALLRRGLRSQAATCDRDGATGEVTLELALRDRGDRRGMLVLSTRGDHRLADCLADVVPGATWPSGHLDGLALFTVTVRVER